MNRIQTLLNLAKEELYAAEILWENTLYRASISRAYYALYLNFPHTYIPQ